MPFVKPSGRRSTRHPSSLVEGDGLIELFGRAHAIGECGDRGDRAFAQHEVVVDELLGAAQVDRVVVLIGDVQPEHVDIEDAGCREVGDDELHVRAAQDVGRRRLRRGDGILGVDRRLLRDVEAGGGEGLVGAHGCSGSFAEGGVVGFAEGDVHGLLVGVEVDRAVAALVAEP